MIRNNRYCIDWVLLIIGNFLLAFAVGVFLLPNNILSGGVAGVSIIINYFIKIPKELIVTILNISLFIIGFITLGKEFAIKTFASSIFFPLFLNIISFYSLSANVMPLLAAIYGGLITGIGVGIVFRYGASTGGMDIPALIINKFSKFELNQSVMIIDFITVLLGLFIFGIEPILLGLISVFTTSFGIKFIMDYPWVKAHAIYIISDKWDIINKRINEELNRGTTIVDVMGGYTNKSKKMILAVVDNLQYLNILNIIEEVDDRSFVISNLTNNVHGEGFSLIKRI